MEYKIGYKYVIPGPAGPFKGKDVVKEKYKKGEYFYAPFGEAIITSCRQIKDTKGGKDVNK